MSLSVNRHLRAVAAVIALLGMLVMSTGVSLVLAAGSASAAPVKNRGGDCDGDQDKKVAKHKGDDDGDCGGGCWGGDEDDKKVAKHKGDDDGDCGGGCWGGDDDDKKIAQHRGDCGGDCDEWTPMVAKHQGDDDCEPPCELVVGKHKSWDDCQDPCEIIIIGKAGTQIGDDDCIAPDPEVTFTDPSCANEGTASWSGTGDHSTFELIDGTVGPGQEITVESHTDFPYEYDDGETSMEFNHTFGPAVGPEDCVELTPAVPTDPSFTDPTCDTDGSVFVPNDPPVEVEKKAPGPVILTSDAEGVHYVVTGSLKAGETAYVDATALPGYVIEEGAQTHWEHTFAMPEGCPVVEPPVVDPPVVQPTVVEAGLVGDVAASVDPRSEQGRVLVALGLALLVIAGGLGLRPGRAQRR